MTYAISNMHYFYYPWEFFLESSKKIGFTEIDVYGCMPHIWIDHRCHTGAIELKESVAKYDLKPVVFTPKNYNYCVYAPVEEHFLFSERYYHNCIDFAATASIKNIIVSLPENYCDHDEKLLFKNAVSALRRLCAYASEKKVKLLIETSKCNFLSSIDDMESLIKALNYPIAGISLNMEHIKQAEESITLWLNRFGERIKYVKVADRDEKAELELSGYKGKKGIFVPDDNLWDDPVKASGLLL